MQPPIGRDHHKDQANQPSLEVKALAERLYLLFRQSSSSAAIILLDALLLYYILEGNVDSVILNTWATVVCAIQAIRLLIFAAFYRYKPSPLELLRWGKAYYVTLIVSSLSWGVGGLILAQNVAFEFQFVIFFFLVGLTGGAIASYSSVKYLAIGVVVILLLPITIWFMQTAERIYVLSAIASSTLIISTTFTVKVLSERLIKSFRLEHELSEQRELAIKESRTDYLTGLDNRRAFMDDVGHQFSLCLRAKLPASLVILDIDYFKQINDQYGHPIGDQALITLADILRSTLRNTDISGRLGGEEFALFLPDTNREAARLAAEKLRAKIAANPIEVDGQTFNITVSMGIGSDKSDLQGLILEADQALYHAKQSGRNCVC